MILVLTLKIAVKNPSVCTKYFFIILASNVVNITTYFQILLFTSTSECKIFLEYLRFFHQNKIKDVDAMESLSPL